MEAPPVEHGFGENPRVEESPALGPIGASGVSSAADILQVERRANVQDQD